MKLNAQAALLRGAGPAPGKPDCARPRLCGATLAGPSTDPGP